MQIPSFLQSLLTKLIGSFSAAVHAALESVHNLKISDALQQAAHDAVRAVESSGGTGSDKFNSAVAVVQAQFVEFAKGAIQTAVQNAWGSLFGK